MKFVVRSPLAWLACAALLWVSSAGAQERPLAERALVIFRVATYDPTEFIYYTGVLVSDDGFVVTGATALTDAMHSEHLDTISAGLVYTHPDGVIDVDRFEASGGIMTHEVEFVSSIEGFGGLLLKVELPPEHGPAPFVTTHPDWKDQYKPKHHRGEPLTIGGLVEDSHRQVVASLPETVVDSTEFVEQPTHSLRIHSNAPLVSQMLAATANHNYSVGTVGGPILSGNQLVGVVSDVRTGTGIYVDTSQTFLEGVPLSYLRRWLQLGRKNFSSEHGFTLPRHRRAYFADDEAPNRNPMLDLQLQQLEKYLQALDPSNVGDLRLIVELYCYLVDANLDVLERVPAPAEHRLINAARADYERIMTNLTNLIGRKFPNVDPTDDDLYVRGYRTLVTSDEPIDTGAFLSLEPGGSLAIGVIRLPTTAAFVLNHLWSYFYVYPPGIAMRHMARRRPLMIRLPTWPAADTEVIRDGIQSMGIHAIVQIGPSSPETPTSLIAAELLDRHHQPRRVVTLERTMLALVSGLPAQELYAREPGQVETMVDILIAFNHDLANGDVSGDRSGAVHQQVNWLLAELAVVPGSSKVLEERIINPDAPILGLPPHIQTELARTTSIADAIGETNSGAIVSAVFAGRLRANNKLYSGRPAVITAIREMYGHVGAYAASRGGLSQPNAVELIRNVRTLSF